VSTVLTKIAIIDTGPPGLLLSHLRTPPVTVCSRAPMA